jgi:hypothetical protein
MKIQSFILLATLLLPASIHATPPATQDSARSRVQAEQAGKQARAAALLHYLAEEPARRRSLQEASDRLYAQAFAPATDAQRVPDAAAIGLSAWRDALATLPSRELPQPAKARLATLQAALEETTRLLGLLPGQLPQEGSPNSLFERQRALMGAAASLGELLQAATGLDAPLQLEASRAGSEARRLADQLLLGPAPAKGEKP